jgi:hypothetical protein
VVSGRPCWVRGHGPVVLAGITSLLAGAVLGVVVAVLTPAHIQIAGSDALVRLHPGRSFDSGALSSTVLTARRATVRSVLGEPIGVSVDLELDPGTLVAGDGSFDPKIIPVYVQAFSDPEQLVTDIEWALTKHLLIGAIVGGAVGLLAFGALRLGRRLRAGRFAALDPEQREAEQRVLSRQQMLRRRVVALGVAVIAIGLVPGADRGVADAPQIRPDPILVGTPLEGVQVGGLLRPALSAIDHYVRLYLADTDSYYNGLRTRLLAELEAQDVHLPSGPDVQSFLFVTDRHCNIGMDRVIVALGSYFDLSLLVSSGDDAFSGTFPFEAACTQNLASKSQQAGMTDVFVGGNHDSPRTLHDEDDQHMKVLDGAVITAEGVRFVGLPDPRTSRYGEGIQPSSARAQQRLLTRQGQAAGKSACAAGGPVIAVLHDPLAGREAIRNGCGAITIALDGHTHRQAGPDPIDAGEQFVGASTGGAPGEDAIERTFASRLTVGPLNHDATINIVSVDTATGALVGVTVCHITPEQDITFTELAG